METFNIPNSLSIEILSNYNRTDDLLSTMASPLITSYTELLEAYSDLILSIQNGGAYHTKKSSRSAEKVLEELREEFTPALLHKHIGRTSFFIDAEKIIKDYYDVCKDCLLYTSPSPRDRQKSRMPSSA